MTGINSISPDPNAKYCPTVLKARKAFIYIKILHFLLVIIKLIEYGVRSCQPDYLRIVFV